MTKEQATEFLREHLNAGDTIACTVTHVTRSGMNRSIMGIICIDGEPVDISPWIAAATGNRFDRNNGGVKMSGCGMDMGFAMVYELSARIFDEFICIGEACPSNDHSNGDRDYTPHKHSDTGYALRQRWL